MILSAEDREQLEKIRVQYLGKSAGRLTAIMKMITKLSDTEKASIGRLANEVKKTIEDNLASQGDALRAQNSKNIAETEWVDVTAPAVIPPQGHLHFQTLVLKEVLEI